MEEEVQEFKDACEAGDIVEVADALTDILYVTFGAALEFGLAEKMEAFFNEVHRSNMSKAGEDGKAIFSETGKVLKGPNYSPPDLKKYLTQNERNNI
jgi:predicted HAD superfamily Cof-like phosphohydrolase